MKLAMSSGYGDESLRLARQLGATHVDAGGQLIGSSDRGYYEFQDLLLLRQKIEDAGLKWAVLGGVPQDWCDKIKLGLPGRDEQIENWCKSLRNMGAAGVPVLGYFFSLRCRDGNYGLRTSKTTRGRGGAVVPSFDYDLVRGARQDYWDPPLSEELDVTDDQMWENLAYFLKAVIPVAEEAGVKMALHPDDPPISPIAGVARIMRSHEALKRFIEIVPSESNGLWFCQGTISEMPGDVLDAIRYFGRRDKIFYVHFRNVTGTVPAFAETFLDEGHVNALEAMLTYKEVGYEGALMYDHVPRLDVDGDKNHASVAFAVGYMRALLDTVDGESGDLLLRNRTVAGERSRS